MVINMLLDCVVSSVNDMKSTFFEFKWTSWHCHVKKTEANRGP